jgi:hypothetical protein
MIEPRVDLEYHKGRICLFKYQICQEGYCSQCHLYKGKLKKVRLIAEEQFASATTRVALGAV